jgi:hypothetical protein
MSYRDLDVNFDVEVDVGFNVDLHSNDYDATTLLGLECLEAA